MNLKNKKVLITGATGGIGNSIVEKMDELGASIIATGTNEEKLKNLSNKYKNIQVEKFNLEDHKNVEEFINKVDTKLDGLEFLLTMLELH